VEKKMSDIAVGDADGLIALILPMHPNHELAVAGTIAFAKAGIEVVFPSTVFPEAITSLKRAANQPEKAHLIAKQFAQGIFNVVYVDEDIMNRACQLFDQTKSKQNTFFDALVAATAERLDAKYIFSFDNWYPKLGYKLFTQFPRVQVP
jgi:predicted nucleic acid-binding protein